MLNIYNMYARYEMNSSNSHIFFKIINLHHPFQNRELVEFELVIILIPISN